MPSELSEEQNLVPDEPAQKKKPRRICFFLQLNPSVTHINFISYLFAALFTVCFFVFLSATQGFILGQILRVPESELGDNAGSLSFYDELFSLVMVWVWGLVSDVIGRRTVYSAGYILMSIGLFIYTYATNVYPQLLLFRFVFALGGSAASSMLTAVLADYAGEEDRGKISAIIGLMTGLGALLALFVFLRLPSGSADPVAGLRRAYFIVAGISAAVGVILFFTLRKSFGNDMEIEAQSEVSAVTNSSSAEVVNSNTGLLSKIKKRRPIWVIAIEGIKAAKDPVILVGYIGGFLARADTIIVTTFLPLWVYKYYISNGLCSARDPNAPDIAETCRQAYVLSSILSGVSQTMTLVGAPIFGILGDKVYRPLTVFIAALFGLIGYIMIHIIANPSVPIIYLAAILIGFGEIGLIVGSLSLVTARYVPADIRGSVAGVYSFFGAAGILMTSKLGGVLFDSWTETAPFFMMAMARVVAIPVIMYIIAKDVYSLIKERKFKRADVEGRAEQEEATTHTEEENPENEKLMTALKKRFLSKNQIGESP